MEENQLSWSRNIENESEDSSSNVEDFYEKIEAPKFVDFTLPDRDRYIADDRYWFCLRVGCDQKHEEELDPEAINKNFILRVMAARSPNIRLRKNMARKCPSRKLECPQSAPAKSSKPRIPRLAVISSISQKISVAKEKVKPPVPKTFSTPNMKVKLTPSKAMTTPRNKKIVPNPKSSQSVQPVAATVSVPQNRMVAKALIFNSPKKVVKTTFSSEIDTPLRKICQGMKKLEIKSHRKCMLGYSIKSPNSFRLEVRKVFPVDSANKQLNTRKLKSQAKTLGHSIKHMDNGKKLEKCCGISQAEVVEIAGSDMEVEGQSRKGSLEVHSFSSSSKSNAETAEELKVIEKTNSRDQGKGIQFSDKSVVPEEILDASTDEINSNGPLVEENLRQAKDEKIVEVIIENERVREDKFEATSEGKAQDSDDKENNSVFNDNRDLKLNNNSTGTKLLGNHRKVESTQKSTWPLNKTAEKSLNATVKDVQGMVKYKKPKATNPKPFRLRTDERGILKEANMEKRLHLLVLPKDPTKLQKWLENDTSHQQEVRIAEISSNKKRMERKPRQISVERRALLLLAHQKSNIVNSPSEVKDSEVKTPENTLIRKKTTYSSSITPQRATNSIRKVKVSIRNIDHQLNVTDETSSKLSKAKVASESVAATVFRSSSRGKRRPKTTIPKEPYFHSIHTPKSCTKRFA